MDTDIPLVVGGPELEVQGESREEQGERGEWGQRAGEDSLASQELPSG